MKVWKLAALLCLTTCAFGQSYYQNNAYTTTYINGTRVVSVVSGAKVRVCSTISGACTQVPVYATSALSTQVTQPITPDGQGNFGFWIPSGSYSYRVLNAQNVEIQAYPFTVGGGTGGSGTVTNLSTGSWPTWLTPSVSNPTTTPSLAVAASSIPNSALANSTITINSTACTLGGSCSITGGGGVSSLNTLAGALNLVAGSNVTITPSGSSITIAATGTNGLSGQTAGYYPKATTATTAIGPGIISDDGSTATVHGNLNINSITGSTQCLHVNSLGTISGSGADCGTGGGGSISGQTLNYLPKATSSTASTISSAVEDTGSSLVYHGTGTQHGIAMPSSSGGLTAPAVGTAGIGTDAVGAWSAYENGGSWSRLCTVGNGLCGGGGGGSFPSTNGLLKNSSTSTSAVATGDTDYASVISTPSISAVHPLVVQANNVFDQNCTANRYSDGTGYCTAGTAYAGAEFIDDTMLACQSNPGKCSAARLLNLLTKWDAAWSNTLGYPITISSTLTPGFFSTPWDQYHQTATGDGRIMVPQALYLYCQKVGVGSSACTTEYTALVTHIKAAWALVPRDSTSHLYQVVAGAEYVCGTAFQEYMRNTGKVASCNVYAAIVSADMLQLASAANDATNISFYTTDLSQLVTGIRANLIDGTSGLLIAATGQNSANLDVFTSSLAVACDLSPAFAPCGILTGAQKTTIENYFNTNYASLVNSNGFVIQTPRAGGWATVGCIQTTGGTPYTGGSCPGTTGTQYQGGFWATHAGWFALAMGQVNPAQVSTLMTTFLNGADPGCEYFDQGSSACNGTTPNLESPQWAVAVNNVFPLGAAYTAGAGCINKYGAVTTSTGCTAGGGLIYGTNNITTAATPVVFSGSTTNNQMLKMTSANTANTAFFLENTSTGGKNWASLVQGSAQGAQVGHLAFLDATDGVVPFDLHSGGTNSVGVSTFKNPGHTAVTIGAGAAPDLGSDAYLVATAEYAHPNAGAMLNRQNSTSGYSSVDLITDGDLSTGWSMQMSPGSTNWRLYDRIAGSNFLDVAHSTTDTMTVNGNLTVTGTCTGCGGSGSSAFSSLTGSTNTTAAMVVGSGASIAPTGTGTIQATNIGSTIAAGSGVTITGSGTTASPYSIASSGGSGCMTPSTQTASGSAPTITFSSIPATCTALRLTWRARGTAGSNGTAIGVTFNSDSTSGHYYYTQLLYLGTSGSSFPGGNTSTGAIAACNVPTGSDPTSVAGVCTLEIPGYAETSLFHELTFFGWGSIGAVSTRMATMSGGGEWTSTAAISSITLTIGTGNIAAGSVFELTGQ